ncbi:MAG: NAD(P)/FAD-dependent oxidoreductase, partial [Planctomycetales bacterium]|nr:NAD(P)/FAD-dependent oxidoreductase [Planctomycetales bacterium]
MSAATGARLEFADQPRRQAYDAIVIGAGPNGLSAAAALAREKRSVLVVEACETIGGGTRTAELTLPGFRHDVCSAIHAMGVVSPFFNSLPLAEHGLVWEYPEVAAAHPLDDGRAAVFHRSFPETALEFGDDSDGYRRLFQRLLDNAERILPQVLDPLDFQASAFHSSMLDFAWKTPRSAAGLAKSYFAGAPARAGFAGMAAHSIRPLGKAFTAAIGVVLTMTVHLGGWPVARGGSQSIADALARYILAHGGEIVVNRRIAS